MSNFASSIRKAAVVPSTASSNTGNASYRSATVPPRPSRKLRPVVHQKKREVVETEEVWENQRGTAFLGGPRFSAKSLLPTDRGPWSDESGNFKLDKDKIQLPSPEWSWVSPSWIVDMSGDVDSEGWEYSFNFGAFPWSSTCSAMSYVRRRRWHRVRRRNVEDMNREKEGIGHKFGGDAGLAIASQWGKEGVVKEVRNGRLDRERIENLIKTIAEAKKTNGESTSADISSRSIDLGILHKVFGTSDLEAIQSMIFEILTNLDYESSKTSAILILIDSFTSLFSSSPLRDVSITSLASSKEKEKGQSFTSALLRNMTFYSDRKYLLQILRDRG